MKNFTVPFFLFLLLAMTSCELVGDIFGAGVYTGVFIVRCDRPHPRNCREDF